MKIVYIQDCEHCPHGDCWWFLRCGHPATEDRACPAAGIPDWCPLPDAPEEVKS